jgi:hypothetical protein
MWGKNVSRCVIVSWKAGRKVGEEWEMREEEKKERKFSIRSGGDRSEGRGFS